MYEAELRCMIEAAKAAAKEIYAIYQRNFHIEYKSDNSPVTDADLASDKIIRERLCCFSSIAWLSEEDKDDLSRLDKRALFVVDPLDGTSDFVARDDSFCLNIALVIDRQPVAGVIMCPCSGDFAYALQGKGSYFVQNGVERQIHVSDRLDHLIAIESKTHRLPEEEAILTHNKDKIDKVVYYGASTKAIYLACGEADFSIRFITKTKEWDVCASDLIVTEAGGIFTDSRLHRFVYNRKDVVNRDGYSMFNRVENTKLLKEYLDYEKTLG